MSERSGGSSFVGHAVTVSGLTGVSRVLGLVRDLILARMFGDTAVASSFAAAFAIPNLFRRLFGEGALSASFLPEYARLEASDPEVARRFGSRTLAMLALVTGVILVVGESLLLAILWFADPLPDRSLFLRLTMVMLPYMPLVCAVAMLGGMLQARGRFAPTAAAPVVLNASMIVAAVLARWVIGLGTEATAFVIGVGIVCAGVLQLLWSLRALGGWRPTRNREGTDESFKLMLRRFIPALIGLGTLQLNAFLDTLIAMWPIWIGPTVLGIAYPLDEASNGILFYAQRLYQFPLGVFGIAVATAVFPALARTSDDGEAFADTLRRGVRLSLFIAVPAAVGLAIIRSDLIRVLYTGGGSAFSEAGAERASLVLLAYAPAVWAYALNQLLTRAFFARGDTTTPMKVAIGMVVLNVALNIALIWSLREAGLAASTAVSATVQCVVLWWCLSKRGVRLATPSVVRAIGRVILVTGAMGMAVWAVVALAPWDSWRGHLARLIGGVVIGAVVYAAGAKLVRCEELRWLLQRRM